MNTVTLVGRLTRDIELKKTSTDTSYCNFTVAVNRKYKNAAGKYDADFISCVAWRNTAEFLANYFVKGKPIALVGTLQTRNYKDKDDKTVYVTEVNTESVSFVPSDNQGGGLPSDHSMHSPRQGKPKSNMELPFNL